MKKTAYGKPIYITNDTARSIRRVSDYNELTIQNYVFQYPECLPISDIDESYNPIIPICKELHTPVGPLDILMITPNGELAIMETKLWRNPEARRKVIAQILDYANELSKWTYEDLQRELNRKLNKKGNTLYSLAASYNSDLVINEADFVDAVTRNLERGKFLLLVIGDGIKEGAASLAEFISNAGHLNFTFGMVELAIYEIDDNKRIIIPRTIVKTTEIQKINIELPSGFKITSSEVISNSEDKKINASPELEKRRDFYGVFWKEFVDNLNLDDPGQPMPTPTIMQNIYVYPGVNKSAWIGAYFSQSKKQIGIYFRCQKNQQGYDIQKELLKETEQIFNSLGSEAKWYVENDLIEGIRVNLRIEDVYKKENREEMMNFFTIWVNNFVNTFRPLLKKIEN